MSKAYKQQYQKLSAALKGSRDRVPAPILPFIVVALVALIGTAWLVRSHAATAALSVETESGTITASAGLVKDTTASGGAAVRFAVTSPTPTVTTTLDGSIKYQTMDGFGVSINAHSWKNGEVKPAIDMLVDQNGSKIFRVVEEMADWETTNDDADPNNYNWNYYDPIYSGATTYDTKQAGANFADLWNTIDYLHQKGIPDKNIILSVMGIGSTWMGSTSVSQANEDEWVEMVSSMAYYGYSHGHTFGNFAPDNEEDWGHNEGITMSAAQYARVMNKVATRLDALGMNTVRLVVPETANTCNGIDTYFPALENYPLVMSKVDHLAVHDYSGGTCDAASKLKSSKYPGVDLWLSEFSIFDQIWGLIDQGSSGTLMWDGFDSVYNHAILNGLGSTPPNDVGNAPPLIAYNATTHVYTPRKSMYQFGQVFKYVNPGMQMVDIPSPSGVTLEAFVDPTSGAITVTGENSSGAKQVIGITLKNVSTTSVFHYSQTNATSNMAAGANLFVTNGVLTVTVPNATVFTATTL